jgi:hypothetical protein
MLNCNKTLRESDVRGVNASGVLQTFQNILFEAAGWIFVAEADGCFEHHNEK